MSQTPQFRFVQDCLDALQRAQEALTPAQLQEATGAVISFQPLKSLPHILTDHQGSTFNTQAVQCLAKKLYGKYAKVADLVTIVLSFTGGL